MFVYRIGVLCAYAANQNLSSQVKNIRRLVNSNMRDLHTFANDTSMVSHTDPAEALGLFQRKNQSFSVWVVMKSRLSAESNEPIVVAFIRGALFCLINNSFRAAAMIILVIG